MKKNRSKFNLIQSQGIFRKSLKIAKEYKKNSDNDILNVFREEIEDIFYKLFGKLSLMETWENTKDMLFNTGEELCKKLGREDAINCLLGQYIYYLDNHFYNLLNSFMTIRKQNTDVFQRLEQIEDEYSIYIFEKYGFYCYLLMSKEMQKAIFNEKRYNLFWDELYHFWIHMKSESEKDEYERIMRSLTELQEKGIIVQRKSDKFIKGKIIKKTIGRPSLMTLEVLMKFTELLEKNEEKKYTLEKMYKIAAKNSKMKPDTIRKWLNNLTPKIPNPKNSNRELTRDDINIMWKESQKEKNR
jgi:hypothetical protein